MKKTMKEWRSERKMTQKDLSEKTGISYDSIVSYDNMYRVPPVDRGLKIAAALNVHPKDIKWKEEE